jgi:hypothetical protein
MLHRILILEHPLPPPHLLLWEVVVGMVVLMGVGVAMVEDMEIVMAEVEALAVSSEVEALAVGIWGEVLLLTEGAMVVVVGAFQASLKCLRIPTHILVAVVVVGEGGHRKIAGDKAEEGKVHLGGVDGQLDLVQVGGGLVGGVYLNPEERSRDKVEELIQRGRVEAK